MVSTRPKSPSSASRRYSSSEQSATSSLTPCTELALSGGRVSMSTKIRLIIFGQHLATTYVSVLHFTHCPNRAIIGAHHTSISNREVYIFLAAAEIIKR